MNLIEIFPCGIRQRFCPFGCSSSLSTSVNLHVLKSRWQATKILLEFARADFGFQPRIDLRHFLFLSFLVEGWMEDFLEVLLVGFTCNLVVGIDDVKWVHQEVSICTGL